MEGLLLLIFSKEDLDKVIDPPTIGQAAQLGVPQRIMRTLEAEILNEMNEWMFGRRLINMSIEEQQRVNNVLRSSQPLNNN